MPAHPSRRAAGLTLIELLIAFSLIALIALLLFSGLRVGTRAWELVDNTAERTAELRVARNFLERALAQARPATVTLDAQPYLVFSGDAENLEFVAPLSAHVGVPGLYVLRLSLEGRQPARLVLTRWLLHPDVLAGGGDIPEWEPFDGTHKPTRFAPDEDQDLAAGAFGTTILVDDVDTLELAYFGVQEGEAVGQQAPVDEGDWYEDWLEQDRLPLAVRLRLTTPERSWPDMLIRLPDAKP
jgi:general secretion pathway protein J